MTVGYGRFQDLKSELEVDLEEMKRIAASFQREMELGLEGRPGSLRMLSSHLGSPTGDERGDYLALDFGGTNVRVLLVELRGQGVYREKQRLSFPLKDKKADYDLTCGEADGEQLFDFIAEKIGLIAMEKTLYRLGYTFSFPCCLMDTGKTVLLRWTKEFSTRDVVGRDVGELLQNALRRNGINNVQLEAILNDTVGTLLAAAYQDKSCDIASILGTGHNTSYLEKNKRWCDRPVIINIEAGNFDKLKGSRYDRILDENSENPGRQLLEKMVSGRYLGELVRIVLNSFNKEGLIFGGNWGEAFVAKDIFTAKHICRILGDGSRGLNVIDEVLQKDFSLIDTGLEERRLLREICGLLVERSAKLAAATYHGVICHQRFSCGTERTIAFDGSLFEKIPAYADVLESCLQELAGHNGIPARMRLVKDGSGIGAAVAAALAKN